MKYFITPIVSLLFLFSSLNSIRSYGQQHTVQSKNAMNALPGNYRSFTLPYHNVSDEVLKSNTGFEQHPELGTLFAETPCDNCYELIGKRTEISKTFVKEGTGGRDILQQTSTGAMHYRDAGGNWRTIRSQLQPDAAHKGVYAASEQPVPVTISAEGGFTSLGKAGENFRFNNGLELIYAKPDGSEVSLGKADWSSHTAGDDGVYVTNAWPGVDIEMRVVRGAVKTNFLINHAMPGYADGQLLVRDHLQMDNGMTLFASGQTRYSGNLEVRNAGGEKIYAVSAATVFEKNNVKGTLKMLEYHINEKILDISLPGNFLNRPASSYPVIIDPLVATATSSSVSGSTYSPSWTTGCVYSNAATVPGDISVTDVQFTFQYVTSGGAILNNGAFDFYLGACRSPVPTYLYWNCNSLLTGTCTGTDASIYPAIASCMPPPQCAPYNLNLTMNFYQNYAADAPCGIAYISAGTPLTITVSGHTIETSAITALPSIVCQGQPTTLSATTSWGVPPYSYVWTPGGFTGSSISIMPSGTTSYTVTATDACGYSSSSSTTITVNPVAPINGVTTVCAGGSSTLTDPVTGGTWSSSNNAVATIGTSSGIFTGVTVGTAVITYTTPAGCTSTTSVTVNLPVAPIAGTLKVCQGGNTTLTDVTPGGTWSSGTPSVASIGLTSGLVSGFNGGTTTISYITYGGGCSASAIFTVNPVSAITGSTTVCFGGTTTLGNAVSGGTWTSGNPGIATVTAATGIVTGVAVGAAVITYTTPAGCAVTASVLVNPLTPIVGAPAICQGSTTSLSDATLGGTWSSLSSSVATVGIVSGVATGVSPGIATIKYTTSTGCIATLDLTVNSLPGPITGAGQVCSSLALGDGVAGGNWTSSNTSVATVGPSSGIVYGVSSGVVTITYTMAGGCLTTTTLNVDPVTSISGAPTICQGNTTSLTYPTSGGTWSSSSLAVATVDISSGLVSGVSSGTATISYTLPTGCIATKAITVNAISPISGSSAVCQGHSITLSDPAGGTWTSSAPAVATIGLSTGVASGVSQGISTITFTTAAGCSATKTITVNPLAAITGMPVLCQGSTTALGDATSGGTWASMNPFVASISASSGLVTGSTAGTALINYTTAEGCVANITVTVNALPLPIAGIPTVCQGSTTTLVDALAGGIWSTSDPLIASVGAASGIVTGMMSGTAIVAYTTTAGCSMTTSVTVNPITPIMGIASMCAGNTTALSDATPEGTWSSANTLIATADPLTGVVTGVAAGTVFINYTTDAGCVATRAVTVFAVPAAIAGVKTVCAGSTTTLSNSLPGGTWASSDMSVATVGFISGVVTGVAANTSTVTYTTTGGCFVSTPVTVNPLPANIAGATAICQGSTTTLSDDTTGGAWSSSSTVIASVDGVLGVVAGLSAGTTVIKYTTAAGCFKTTTLTVNPLPSAITGITTLCEGTTSLLHDDLAGGTWNTSDITVAGIGISTGVLSGISAGVATVTYTSASGCIMVAGIQVNPTPKITGTLSSGPTKCTTTDGTITLTGLVPGGSYSVNYSVAGGGTVTITLLADALGNIIITGLSAGSYSGFTVTTTLGCVSNLVNGPIVLSLPPTPPTPTAGNNTPICAGTDLQLTATDATTGVSYSWTGPGGFTSNLQNPLIANASVAQSGTYSVTATQFECVSAPATTIVVVHPIPDITNATYSNPKTCLGTEGTITLSGLASGVTYTVNYSFNGAPASFTAVADASGNVTVTGLSSGTYAGIYVSSFTCISNTVGPLTLTDPNPPPAPELTNNSPICAGKTLKLGATDAISDVTFDWVGPNGFTSDLQYPEIPDVRLGDSGVYTLTIKYLNCPTAATETVVIRPPVSLTNVTISQVVPYGGTIQLWAEGAEYYLWSPNDGSLSNPNINNPLATPQDSTTYTVEGMNQWGCVDYGYVSLSMDYSVNEFIPTGFTPNGDGHNDIFRIGNIKYDKLVDFSVFNRWGQLIYHNTYDPKQGWDGTFNGVPQEMGVYFYNIILASPSGKNKNFKGEVTLIR